MFGLSKQTLIIIAAVAVVLLLFSVRDDSAGAGTGTGQSSSGDCSFTVNADVLNVRESPKLGAPVVDTLTQNEETEALATVRNGFRKLDNEQWAANNYLEPASGNSCG